MLVAKKDGSSSLYKRLQSFPFIEGTAKSQSLMSQNATVLDQIAEASEDKKKALLLQGPFY